MTRKLMLMMVVVLAVAACQPSAAPIGSASPTAAAGGVKVVAAETFLADIAQQVAGTRLTVKALMPIGVDPHSFEPTPQDVALVADSAVFIVNGAGFEIFLEKLLQNAGGQRAVIEASAGLKSRQPSDNEILDDPHGDPHFWLDPNNVVTYVENIRDALSKADPAGVDTYKANAAAYIMKLEELDRWIADQVAQIPEADRLLVTNHESFGYYADRYGFRIIGTIVPSVGTEASPSAQQLAALIDHIKASGAKAIFLETGTNPQLAQQVASETGAKVVTDLFTHSITEPNGRAPTYLDMMRFNTTAIVSALK
ncbi:MAG: metal ABC transporter substrate-binding protein [Anaerolineae bacterium]